MKILDLFAGLGGVQRRELIEARGHTYHTLDIEDDFNSTYKTDILKITAEQLGDYDFIWASPPCESFSIASVGHHWHYDKATDKRTPKTDNAIFAQQLVEHTLKIIKDIEPRYGWLMENPRGVLRKLPVVAGLPRTTVTYCRYGDTRMKPTDIWGWAAGWKPRPMCHNGNPDHEAAPRGSSTGTQGIKGYFNRSVVPWELWDEILTSLEKLA